MNLFGFGSGFAKAELTFLKQRYGIRGCTKMRFYLASLIALSAITFGTVSHLAVCVSACQIVRLSSSQPVEASPNQASGIYISVASLPVSVVRQLPATELLGASDLGSLVAIGISSNGQEKTLTQTTPFIVVAYAGSEITATVSAAPSGSTFACIWAIVINAVAESWQRSCNLAIQISGVTSGVYELLR